MRESGDRCPEALFARSRRGPLSPVERRALDAHLGVCGLCRAATVLANLYDDIPEETDEAAHACAVHLADRLVAERRRRPRASRYLALAFAAVMLAMAGVATALVLVRRSSPTRVQNEPPIAAPLGHGTGSHRIAARTGPGLLGGEAPADEGASAVTGLAPAVTGVAPAPPPRLGPPAPVETRPGLPATPAPRASRRHPAPPPLARTAPIPLEPVTAPAEGPAELFTAANVSRLARELPQAVERYRLLQSRFPGSDEARLSFLSTGDVLQRLGQPAQALAEFDRYLETQPSGALASEALFGRARCLDVLGRRTEAVEAWERLLRDFPDSIYESAARRRLAELAR